MQGFQKYIIGAIILIIIAVGGLYFIKMRHDTAPDVVTTPPVTVPTTHTYATSTFSIVYPDGYTADPSYAYQGVPKKPIPGVKFSIPLTVATGTNLSIDSGVSVESLPRAKVCTGDIYIYQNVKASDLTVGSTTYSVASMSDAGAGNFYEEQVYAIAGSHPCTAVRYFIHSTNIDNYTPGTARAFDHEVLISAFDGIRNSLILNQ